MSLFASRTAPAVPVATSVPLEVIRLDHSSWRISNSLIDPADHARIMGFIERLERDRFEVLLLTPPTGWAYVESFGLALSAFTNREHFQGEIEGQRDADIEPPEPSLFHRVKRRSPGPEGSRRKH
ncbi:hypothetical protein HDC94_000171 [Leifsonia sp. AK011]|uniref:hypothetical protein n=1 Tax=Leifsonia sp. AK011 TaxID=2723075 RepID=UPI0015CD761D|nr:hypothetical protein [Leifsonia sp. AK011]NYF09015.1 hypothetical protein [Leifsonia sp. AK011]